MNKKKSRRTPLAQRFAAKTRRAENGCLEWTGTTLPEYVGGYGTVYVGDTRRNARAHVIAWELVNGPVPAGMKLLHSCDNPICVEVAHLSLGTQRDNLQDMREKGRAVRPVRRPRTLTAQERAEIVAQYNPASNVQRLAPEERTSGIALARRYGVTRYHIYRVIREHDAA